MGKQSERGSSKNRMEAVSNQSETGVEMTYRGIAVEVEMSHRSIERYCAALWRCGIRRGRGMGRGRGRGRGIGRGRRDVPEESSREWGAEEQSAWKEPFAW